MTPQSSPVRNAFYIPPLVKPEYKLQWPKRDDPQYNTKTVMCILEREPCLTKKKIKLKLEERRGFPISQSTLNTVMQRLRNREEIKLSGFDLFGPGCTWKLVD